MFKQRLVRWLGQVVQMDDDRMPKKLLHEKLSQETSPTGRPQLGFKDVCQRDLKPLQINTQTEEATASDRQHRRQAVKPRALALARGCWYSCAHLFLLVSCPRILWAVHLRFIQQRTKQENNTERKEIMATRERNETCVSTDN